MRVRLTVEARVLCSPTHHIGALLLFASEVSQAVVGLFNCQPVTTSFDGNENWRSTEELLRDDDTLPAVSFEPNYKVRTNSFLLRDTRIKCWDTNEFE